jgi:hypothetical protein
MTSKPSNRKSTSLLELFQLEKVKDEAKVDTAYFINIQSVKSEHEETTVDTKEDQTILRTNVGNVSKVDALNQRKLKGMSFRTHNPDGNLYNYPTKSLRN